jgi:hypothetical protein
VKIEGKLAEFGVPGRTSSLIMGLKFREFEQHNVPEFGNN